MEHTIFADTNARLEAERVKRLEWDNLHKDMSFDALQKELEDATARVYEPGQAQRHASIICALEAKREAHLEAERAKLLELDERHKGMNIDALEKEREDAATRLHEPGQALRHASIASALEPKRLAHQEAERAKRQKLDKLHNGMSIDALQKELEDAAQRRASIVSALEAKRMEKEKSK